jgi:hypothetical protein
MADNRALQQAKDALDQAIAQKKISQELLRNLGPAVIETLRPVLEEISRNTKVSKEELVSALSQIKIDVPKADVPHAQVDVKIPEIVVPEPKVTVNVPPIPAPKIPEIKIPKITVPKPEVTVNVPPIKIPDLTWPKENMPIEGWVRLQGVDIKSPLPVQLRDASGKPVNLLENLTTIIGGSGGAFRRVRVDNPATEPVNVQIVSGAGATSAVNIVDSNGIAYSGSNPLPTTASVTLSAATGQGDGSAALRTIQAGDTISSVYVVDAFGSQAVSGVFNPDNRLRVSVETGGSGLTDSELRASSVDVQQASGATWSVSVNDVFRTTVASTVLNSDNRLRVSLEPGGSGLTDTELRASSVDVQQASGANWSVFLTGSSGSIAATIVDSSGVAYSGSNPLPITGSIAAGTEYTEDDAAAANPVGVQIISRRRDTLIEEVTADGDVIAVNSSQKGELFVSGQSFVSSYNSTTVALAGAGTFTGETEDIRDYSGAGVNVYSDVASATDGFKLQWSSDGTNWDHVESYTVSAATGFSIQAAPRARYFRVVYTNGAVGQAAFRLQSILNKEIPTPRKTRLGETPNMEDPGILTQSVISGATTAGGGALVQVKVSPSGAIQVGGDINAFQASGSIDSVNIMQVLGSPVVVGSGYQDNALRVVNATDAITSVNVVNTNSIDVQQASGATWSVSVNDAFRTTVASTLINSDNRLRVSLEPGGSGLTDTELRAASVDVQQASGANWSVFVTGSTGSLAATIIDSTGVGYSGSNPLPITGTVAVSDITNSVKSALIDSTGVQYSGSNPLPITGTVAVSDITNSVKSALIDSTGVQYSGSNPVPMTWVSGAGATVGAANIDSTGVQYSGSNPMPITGNVNVNGSLNSVLATGVTLHDAVDDGDAPVKIGGVAVTANPAAVAGGDRVKFTGDTAGRQLMRPIHVRGLLQTAYVTDTEVKEAVLLAGVSGEFRDLVYVMAANESDAAIVLDFRQTTGGNVQMTVSVPAYGTSGVSLPVPIPQDHADASWTVRNNATDNSNTVYAVTALFSREV